MIGLYANLTGNVWGPLHEATEDTERRGIGEALEEEVGREMEQASQMPNEERRRREEELRRVDEKMVTLERKEKSLEEREEEMEKKMSDELEGLKKERKELLEVEVRIQEMIDALKTERKKDDDESSDSDSSTYSHTGVEDVEEVEGESNDDEEDEDDTKDDVDGVVVNEDDADDMETNEEEKEDVVEKVAEEVAGEGKTDGDGVEEGVNGVAEDYDADKGTAGDQGLVLDREEDAGKKTGVDHGSEGNLETEAANANLLHIDEGNQSTSTSKSKVADKEVSIAEGGVTEEVKKKEKEKLAHTAQKSKQQKALKKALGRKESEHDDEHVSPELENISMIGTQTSTTSGMASIDLAYSRNVSSPKDSTKTDTDEKTGKPRDKRKQDDRSHDASQIKRIAKKAAKELLKVSEKEKGRRTSTPKKSEHSEQSEDFTKSHRRIKIECK